MDFELFADLSSFSPFAGSCWTLFVASFPYRCSQCTRIHTLICPFDPFCRHRQTRRVGLYFCEKRRDPTSPVRSLYDEAVVSSVVVVVVVWSSIAKH